MEVTRGFNPTRPVPQAPVQPLPEFNHPNLPTSEPIAEQLFPELELPFKLMRYASPGGNYDYLKIEVVETQDVQGVTKPGQKFSIGTNDTWGQKRIVEAVHTFVQQYAALLVELNEAKKHAQQSAAMKENKGRQKANQSD